MDCDGGTVLRPYIYIRLVSQYFSTFSGPNFMKYSSWSLLLLPSVIWPENDTVYAGSLQWRSVILICYERVTLKTQHCTFISLTVYEWTRTDCIHMRRESRKSIWSCLITVYIYTFRSKFMLPSSGYKTDMGRYINSKNFDIYLRCFITQKLVV